MPTTFSVFSLGQLAIWDPTEGDQTLSTGAVDQALGVYGSAADPLFDGIQVLSSAGNGFGGGNATAYDLDNTASNDQFSLDGGAVQTHDASMVFNAVITYKAGGTANITAVVFQDVNGNTYWSPELSNNADQAAIEAFAVESLQLVSPIYAQGQFGQGFSLTGDRVDSNLICFAGDAMITCPDGVKRIADLSIGDLVMTMDNGARPIRWIGSRTVAAIGDFAPIKIKTGAYGANRDLEVSPQHRIILSTPKLQPLYGISEGLAAAKHLVDGDTVSRREGGFLDYYHLLFDAHEIIWANGVPAESLYLGDVSQRALSDDSLNEIYSLFPRLVDQTDPAMALARPVLRGHEARLVADLGASATFVSPKHPPSRRLPHRSNKAISGQALQQGRLR